jgi:hypothetical protein
LVRLAESLAVVPRRGEQLRARPGVRRVVSAPYLVTYRIDETQRVVYVQRFSVTHNAGHPAERCASVG